jgi:HD-like signal output (HDOD) protein
MEGDKTSDALNTESLLAQTLARIEIPPRPALLDKVMAEMQSEDPDFRELARIITADVGMAASLVKTANAPFFGLRNKASTVRDALTMLGLLSVLRTIASHALRNSLPATPTLEGFWERSTRIAYLCGWLVRQVGVKDGVRVDDAYTYGLFHDCGIPILIKAFDGYQATYSSHASEPDQSLVLLEMERHGVSHAMVGCALAKGWFLPEIHAQAILHHHDADGLAQGPNEIASGMRRLIALGHAAEWLDEESDRIHDYEWQRLGPSCLEILDISSERLVELKPEAQAFLKDHV